MRPSRGMGCIARDKMPGAKGKTIVRKDKPQFVKEYKKGGDVRLLGPSETVNFNKKRVSGRAKKKDAFAEGGETKVNQAGK
jgi:hypothetical protein